MWNKLALSLYIDICIKNHENSGKQTDLYQCLAVWLMSLGRGLASCWLPATVTLEVRNFFQSMVYGHTGYTLDDLHSEYNLTYINMYLFQPNSDTFVDRLYWWEDLLPTIIIPTCPSISNIHNLQETLLQYAMPLSPFYYQYYTFPPGTVYYVSCVCLSLILLSLSYTVSKNII